jgi:hypothetical protein
MKQDQKPLDRNLLCADDRPLGVIMEWEDCCSGQMKSRGMLLCLVLNLCCLLAGVLPGYGVTDAGSTVHVVFSNHLVGTWQTCSVHWLCVLQFPKNVDAA